MDFSLIQHFGYAEMYEWKTKQSDRFGYVVELDTEEPDKIVKATNARKVIGVSSINYAELSDNPTKWPKSYYRDPVGDTYMLKKTICRGTKKYNQIDEFAYISTKKDEIYIPREFEKWDKEQKYVQRVDRQDWSPVTLIGKALVYDFGECNDLYCQLYKGNDESRIGTVVSVYNKSLPKYRVIGRYSKNTLLIFFK